MERTDEPRLQLLFASKDPIHMKGLTAILYAHGIHTVREPTSLPWRSIGIDSLCMVAPVDYPTASALCEGFARENNLTSVSANVPSLVPA
jgi:hypothetical protein